MSETRHIYTQLNSRLHFSVHIGEQMICFADAGKKVEISIHPKDREAPEAIGYVDTESFLRMAKVFGA
jgi:hypothetical protein